MTIKTARFTFHVGREYAKLRKVLAGVLSCAVLHEAVVKILLDLSPMPFSPEVKANALIASGRHCCVCHKFCGVRVECHHILPEAKGGSDDLENCIPLCFDCHAEVEHYNSQHPKGNKFTVAELRGHRDNWQGLHRASLIEAPATRASACKSNEDSSPDVSDPSEPEVVILLCLASRPTGLIGGFVGVKNICVETGISSMRVNFYLEELRSREFVHFLFGMGDQACWSATHEGRRFLVENDLIP